MSRARTLSSYARLQHTMAHHVPQFASGLDTQWRIGNRRHRPVPTHNGASSRPARTRHTVAHWESQASPGPNTQWHIKCQWPHLDSTHSGALGIAGIARSQHTGASSFTGRPWTRHTVAHWESQASPGPNTQVTPQASLTAQGHNTLVTHQVP